MWYNPPMTWLLRSKFHNLISKNTLLLTVTGRKSGHAISTPVNYLRDGQTLWVASDRQRNWWRNLAGGAPVTLLLQGQVVKGTGKAITEAEELKQALIAYFKLAPGMARYFDVRLLPDGYPIADDLARAIKKQVLIRINLS